MPFMKVKPSLMQRWRSSRRMSRGEMKVLRREERCLKQSNRLTLRRTTKPKKRSEIKISIRLVKTIIKKSNTSNSKLKSSRRISISWERVAAKSSWWSKIYNKIKSKCSALTLDRNCKIFVKRLKKLSSKEKNDLKSSKSSLRSKGFVRQKLWTQQRETNQCVSCATWKL